MKLGSPVYPLTNVDIPIVEGMYAKESRDAVVVVATCTSAIVNRCRFD